MPNDYFRFKQFTIYQSGSAMKVGTDSVLFGVWTKIDPIKELRVLDVGTGSGILAIMLAQRAANLKIDGVEVDEQAFLQAQENVNACPWADRITLYNDTFQSFATKNQNTYDLVISNPPYFIQSLGSPNQQRSIARHTDSLSQEELLQGIITVMKPTAHFSVVLPLVEGISFIHKAEKSGLYCTRKISVKPNPQKEPKRLLLEFSYTKTAIEEAELCIDSGIRHQYSREYIELTKEFYLKF